MVFIKFTKLTGSDTYGNAHAYDVLNEFKWVEAVRKGFIQQVKLWPGILKDT